MNVLPRLSFPTAARVGSGFGRAVGMLDARHRRVADRNLATAFPDATAAERRAVSRAAFAQAGRTIFEMLWSARLGRGEIGEVGVVDGYENMEAALSEGRGALLASGHFGNWELMGVVFGLVGMPLQVIARRLADPDLEQALHALRTRTGNQVISKDGAVKGSLRALKQRDVVAVMIDQNTIPSQATFVPFFGRLAATSRLLAQLHQRTGAPIVPSFAVPDGRKYRFVIEPALELDDISSEDAIERITAAATLRLEEHVRKHPEAWLWIHDRWRTRPE
jgi:KDO2-lipid IV(A) lauroyltransferase